LKLKLKLKLKRCVPNTQESGPVPGDMRKAVLAGFPANGAPRM
jgi:hypothetical protein